MAYTQFDKDMNIISALNDEPNDVGGLSAAQLKAKFDEGGKAIKDYLNGTLLPQMEATGATKEELNQIEAGVSPDLAAANAVLASLLGEESPVLLSSGLNRTLSGLAAAIKTMMSISGSVPLDQLNTYTFQPVPTGSVFWLASETIPTGYLLCDGRLVNKADYPALFQTLGDTFGTATETQFYLPNLLAKFVRGAGTSGGYSATFGATQEATYYSRLYDKLFVGAGNGDKTQTGSSSNFSPGGSGVSGTLTSVYARPYNIALTPIIKY